MRVESSPDGRKKASFIEEARRAQIVDAAVRTVAEYGYAHASLSRIARTAGISKSVISYHFDGKDELLTRVVTGFIEQAEARIEALSAQQQSACGRVRAWIGGQHAYFGEHPTAFRATSDIINNHRRPDGTLVFRLDLEEEADELAQILRDGQRDGELRDFEPHSTARVLLRSSGGVLASWSTDTSLDLMAETEILLDLITRAIARNPL